MSRQPPQDPKTKAAAERHRTHPDPPIHGQNTHRQLQDTDGEGGVGGSVDGLYLRPPSHTGPESPRLSPEEAGALDYERAHAELGDASADFTGERAQKARETVQGEPEITASLTSSGVMEDNVDLGAETPGSDSAIQKP